MRRAVLPALLLASLLLGCAGPVSSPARPAWTPLNEGLRSHAPVLTVLFDRSGPGRLLAGVNAERSLFASDDGGETWAAVPDVPWTPPVYALLQPVGAPSSILAATGSGLHRSSDGGRSWTQVPTGGAPGAAYSLAQQATGTLYLGGEGAEVLRSTDGGVTWRPLAALPAGTSILSLATSPSGDWLLAGTDGAGLFTSLDGGATWRHVAIGGETFVSAILLRPAGAPPCAGAGHCALVRTRSGLLATADGGRNWRKVQPQWDGRSDALIVAGAAPTWLLATDRGGLYRSLDGEHWTASGDGLGRRGAVFTLAAEPERADRIFAGTENGLYLSDDGGRSWRAPAAGPGHPSADALAVAGDGSLYLANLDGVFFSPDGGEGWERRSRGLPPVSIVTVAVAPSAPGILYAGATGAGLFRSDDRGLTWSATGWEAATVPGIAVHPADPERVYFRVAFERVYSSDDGGRTIIARWTGFTPFTEVMSLAIDPLRPDQLYAGGTDALYRSLNGAESWQAVAPELDGQTVFAPPVTAGAAAILLAGATKGVYSSSDDGRSWRPLGAGLEEITVTALARHPDRAEWLYAGTRYRGVYRSRDAGRTWLPAGLEGVSVNSLLVSPDGRWLCAATPEGFFRAEAG